MLGRFLELSLHAPSILESIEFWERLGFRQATTNDIWSHPYAVLSDGTLTIGLHAYEFESPSLTFVRPDLAQHLPALRAVGVDFEFAKTADDAFHEAGFLTPDGQMVALLESRTFSPPLTGDDDGGSLLGGFGALRLPVRRVDRTLPFFAKLGMAVIEYDEDAPTTALLAMGSMRLLLDEDARTPVLEFVGADAQGLERLFGEVPDASPEGLKLRCG
ncbi:MAG: hypothetical protein LC632_02535 [Xanthomonadaceae bacterium]|nr:hypothetical protein [Xanthomonadaceae bacterium]